jgi:hypothetical protein
MGSEVKENNKTVSYINVHKLVSELKTPKHYVEDKMGIDYVKYPYMRSIADNYYPGWSWCIMGTEIVNNKAFAVHGRLSWIEMMPNGTVVERHGDVTAGHRIQYSKKDPTEFVDLGNDAKAANTDCIKKAFNMYMNISDDIYRAQVKEEQLTPEQIELIEELAQTAGQIEKIHTSIGNGTINGFNFNACVAKLRRITNG